MGIEGRPGELHLLGMLSAYDVAPKVRAHMEADLSRPHCGDGGMDDDSPMCKTYSRALLPCLEDCSHRQSKATLEDLGMLPGLQGVG